MTSSLIFFAFICTCAALPHYFISDTPEVQAEKRRFYELFNKAAEAAAAAPDTNVSPKSQNYQHNSRQNYQAYQPQNPNPQINQNFGNVHRFGAQPAYQTAQQPAYQAVPQYSQKWTGPKAAEIPAGLPGSSPQVANTPEVQAAISSFTKAYNDALVATRSAAPSSNTIHDNYYQSPKHRQYNQPTHYKQPTHYNQNHISQIQSNRIISPPVQPKWTGPLASTHPAGVPGSLPQVPHTSEDLAARAQFAQVYQNQLRSVLG